MNEYEGTRRLLLAGIASAKAKEIGIARLNLERVLNLPVTQEMVEKAHYWLAVISDDEQEKRDHLEEVLGVNPANYQARRLLAVLDGRLDEEEIVDADRLPARGPAMDQAKVDRFTCPNCGARMVYSPDGSSLICEYCDRDKAITNGNTVEEQDFTIGMAQAKGHQRAVAMQAFQCSGCGAVYILSPETLSLSCPHCDSVYGIIRTDTREVIPPEGIIPFSLTREQAKTRAVEWLKQNDISRDYKLAEIKGLYTPLWTFDIGGTLNSAYQVYDNLQENWVNKQGKDMLLVDDLLVNASKTLPKPFEAIISKYDTQGVVSFDPGFTANFLAETYQVTMSDAAIQARAKVLEQMRSKVESDIFETFRSMQLSSMGLIIESYKLILAPVWLAGYTFENVSYSLLVSGQSGDTAGELPPGKLKKFLDWLME